MYTTTVEHDHKKKMYTLLVGSGAITAEAEVSRKRQILTDLQRVKNDIAGQFNRLGVRGVTIAEFAAMECERSYPHQRAGRHEKEARSSWQPRDC